LPGFLQALAALVLFIVTLPLFLLSLLLSSVFIGFPPLYWSRRRGLGGREYTHWKIRSMKPGRETGRVFFEVERLNMCGRLLRKLHLDELPELLLITTRRMNFVGPRPLPSFLLEGLDTSVRETVRPGWTGPAQVWLLRRGSLDKRLQIRLDEHYVHRRSCLYDMVLVIATLKGILRRAPMDMDPEGSEDRRSFAGGKRTDRSRGT
jgi:lipopolysaccharide/colanic/teichoic acid biosynthesis glycosyltransferase